MKEYLENRVTPQRKWYEDKATENKKRFVSYQTGIIFLGALIPVLVALESKVDLLLSYGGPIAAFISACISVLAGLDKLKQPQPNWFNYRANEEALKKEEWLHKYKAGPYKGMEEGEANILFVERVESIVSADIARVTNSLEKEGKVEIPEEPASVSVLPRVDSKPKTE
jgi:hypothetical protein